jgi:hypothetical protein
MAFWDRADKQHDDVCTALDHLGEGSATWQPALGTFVSLIARVALSVFRRAVDSGRARIAAHCDVREDNE